MPPRRIRNRAPNVDPEILEALNQAVAAAVAQAIPAAIAAALPQQPPPPPPPTGEDPPVGNNLEIPLHALLERFQKQKPESFTHASTPIEAENWIAHLEKIFEVIEVSDTQKVKLAAFKLEGDARRWWTALRTAEGNDFVETLVWRDFIDIFYSQYFPLSEREAYVREFVTIRQLDDESITDYMIRFIRIAGIAGHKAGSTYEQAQTF